jgi:MoaA/NifB/PqqE/SkfB family radical SAM enzyme
MTRHLFDHSTLQIETTRRCNLDCIMCMRTNLGDQDLMLDLDGFKVALDSGDFDHAALHGWGEPLLNPAVFDMVAYARTRGVRTEITTNGTLVMKMLDRILASGLDTLVIGLSARDAIPVIMPPLLHLMQERDIRGLTGPDIYLDIVIHSGNAHQIGELLRFGESIGANGIVLHRVFTADRVDPRVGNLTPREERSLFQKIAVMEKSMRTKIFLPPGGSVPCRAVMYGVFVTAGLKITPCPFLPDYHMGDIRNEGINGALSSGAYADFVGNMHNHPVCSQCPLGMGAAPCEMDMCTVSDGKTRNHEAMSAVAGDGG